MQAVDWTIGVIERDGRPDHAAPTTASGAAAFASSVTQRYESRAFVASGADLALAWEAPARVNHYYAAPRVEISPRITVEQDYTFIRGAEQEQKLNPVPAFDEARATALFERLFSRQVRVAPFDSPRDPAPAAIHKHTAEMIHERISVTERILPFRRAPEGTATAADATPMPASHKIDPGWGTPPPPRETPASITLAAPEIRRVADHVMREIDHRSRALRERTGRMPR